MKRIKYMDVMVLCRENLEGFYMFSADGKAQEIKLLKGKNLVQIPELYVKLFKQGLSDFAGESVITHVEVLGESKKILRDKEIK